MTSQVPNEFDYLEEIRTLAEFYRANKNGVQARYLVQSYLPSIWSVPELLQASNFINPVVTPETSRFNVQITGATVILGDHQIYGPGFKCSFAALASSECDAIGYFLELVPVEDVSSIEVVKIERINKFNSSQMYEGIIKGYPFESTTASPSDKWFRDTPVDSKIGIVI